MSFAARAPVLLGALWVGAGLALTPACDGEEEHEGDGAGECDDGADNDRDGRFDCDDEGCAGSPSCGGGDADADADADGDGDGDCDADAGRMAGEVIVREGEFGPPFAEASFAIDEGMPECDDGQRFGECSVTEIGSVTSPDCEWTCTGDQLCWWDADCSTPRCYPFHDALHAGTITVTTETSRQPLVGTWDEDRGDYDWDLESDVHWGEGDVVHIEASGGTFPAFSVDVPGLIPARIATDTEAWTPETFDGSADVPVAWTAGAGEMVIEVFNNQDMVLTCRTADDGSFDLPSEGIAMLGIGSRGSVLVTFSRQASTVVDLCGDRVITGVVRGTKQIQVSPEL